MIGKKRNIERSRTDEADKKEETGASAFFHDNSLVSRLNAPCKRKRDSGTNGTFKNLGCANIKPSCLCLF